MNPPVLDAPVEMHSSPTPDAPRRNRWQRQRTGRPIGSDHSLGFPRVEKDSEVVSASSQSETIVFDTPLIDPGPVRSPVLAPIQESAQSNPPNSESQGSQTPVFGRTAPGLQTLFDDPWQDDEPITAPTPNLTPRGNYRREDSQFNYGAMLWQAIYEGNDPWAEP